jgi:hypothetical protein
LTPVSYLVVDCGPGCSRRGKLGPHDPVAVMARTLTQAVAEVKRLEAKATGYNDEEWSAYGDCCIPVVITIK